jgi:hypothetical protein
VNSICRRLNQRLAGIAGNKIFCPQQRCSPNLCQLRLGQEFLHSETFAGQQQGLPFDQNDSV